MVGGIHGMVSGILQTQVSRAALVIVTVRLEVLYLGYLGEGKGILVC